MKSRSILALIFFFNINVKTAIAQEFYTGVWRSGNNGYELLAGTNWNNFKKKYDDLAQQNLRLINIKTYNSILGRVFTGIWSSGSDAYALTPLGLDWTDFIKYWEDNSKKGLRLINVETYIDNGKLSFLGVFRAGNDNHTLTPINLDWTAFNKFWDENSRRGLRLINIESYMNGGKRAFWECFVPDQTAMYFLLMAKIGINL